MAKGFKLPAWLDLQLQDTARGVQIDHIATVDFRGLAEKLSDPLFGLYFNGRKKQYATEHFHEEFNRLARLLHPSGAALEHNNGVRQLGLYLGNLLGTERIAG